MNKAQTLHSFWSSFGIPAYDENTVPENADERYITYNVATDSLGNVVNLYASIWDVNSTSWAFVETKAEEIAKAIEQRNYELLVGGILKTFHVSIPIDDPIGAVFITKGTPFAQRMSDPSSDRVRRIYLNIQAEYLTAY